MSALPEVDEKAENKPDHNKLRIDLDYKRAPSNPGQPEMSNAKITDDYIGFAVGNVHPNGLEGQMRRIFGRLQRKLDAAIESGADYIELEQAEKDLLRKTFKECKVPANLSKYFMVLEDEIERVTARE